jgi:hypothetical protein
MFKGGRKRVAAPSDRPSWLPSQVWKPTVAKNSLLHLKAGKKKKR